MLTSMTRVVPSSHPSLSSVLFLLPSSSLPFPSWDRGWGINATERRTEKVTHRPKGQWCLGNGNDARRSCAQIPRGQQCATTRCAAEMRSRGPKIDGCAFECPGRQLPARPAVRRQFSASSFRSPRVLHHQRFLLESRSRRQAVLRDVGVEDGGCVCAGNFGTFDSEVPDAVDLV